MSLGVYGNIRPSDVDVKDVEIFYHFSKNRDGSNFILKRLNPIDVLSPVKHNSQTTDDIDAQDIETINGLYNLKLKSSDFGEEGFYNLYIKPREIRCDILDCGILSSAPSVRGIIVDINNVPANDRTLFGQQTLVGYRIEYINPVDKQRIKNFFRIVTSSFFCTPIVSNVNNTNQKSIRYQYSNTPTNYLFLTLTPSSAPSNNPNAIPFIGQPGQKIILSNTFFNPVSIDINVVKHDSTTLAYALYGNQVKAMDSGIYTVYDDEGNIFHQADLFEIKDEFNETLYEVKRVREDIDETLDFDNILN